MKKQKLILNSIVLISVLSLLFSCTVSKRHFRPGFHVEWKKGMSSRKSFDTKQQETAVLEQDLLAENTPMLQPERVSLDNSSFEKQSNDAIVHPLDEKSTNQQVKQHPKKANPEISTTPNFNANQHLKQTKFDDPIPDNTKVDSRKTEPLTWLSLGLFLVAGVFGAWVGTLFSWGFTLVMGMTFLGFGAVLFGLALAFLIVSLISFIRIKKYPERYKNRAFTQVLFVFSLVSFTVAGLIFLIAIALDSSDKIM